MIISVSPSLAHLHPTVIEKDHAYDVSIILITDQVPWMERAFRSIHPHYVRTVEEGEHILKLYKEINSVGNRCNFDNERTRRPD
jgi:hypothetical protein